MEAVQGLGVGGAPVRGVGVCGRGGFGVACPEWSKEFDRS